MSKFFVGERVRLVKEYDYLPAGSLGIVVGVDDDLDWPVSVDFDDAQDDAEFEQAIFELFGVQVDPGWPVREEEIESV